MTPQSSFMVVAPIDAEREADLRALLASMNDAPGRAKPDNALIPFGAFETLHFARLLVVDDQTLDDIRAHALPRNAYPIYLAFLGDVDGDADDFLKRLATDAGKGLNAIFSCCEGFSAGDDLLEWMKRHRRRSAADYVNWRGRTVRRAREDAALREGLERYADGNAQDLAGLPPQQIHARLRQFVEGERSAGRLALTPEASTPLGWWIANALNLIGVPLLLLLFSPLLIVVGVIVLIRLRRLEKSDPEMCFRVDQAHSDELAALEDHDVSNQFSALGAVKPGIVRLWTVTFVLVIIDWSARHLYTRGRLARVRTIHFARWVWIDENKRILFLSNYDGSLESYMDDFINKVGFGLNVVFSNGIGYPRANWLLCDGCKDERKFKEYLRRHQLPTEVWYAAYPDLTAVDLERNGRIRDGIELPSMSEAAAREWMGLL
ncbi:MAG TPA: hypothetical protein VGK44_01195 [Casimicrobiaceae bacterium]